MRPPLFAAVAAAALLAACGRRPPLPAPGKAGDPPVVSVALSTNSIAVGDPVAVDLRVAHDAGAAVTIPPPDAGGDAVVVRSRKTAEQPLGNGRALSEVRLDLTSFTLGEHQLFTGAVSQVSAAGVTNTVPMPDAALTVRTVLAPGDTSPRAQKGPLRWRRAIPRWLWVLPLIALIAALAGWVALRLLGRRGATAPAPPPIPPYEVALAALRRLLERGWHERGEAEPFYTALSAIVRRYIEDRFGLRAPEQTTEEFIREASRSTLLDEAQRARTEAFLVQSDLVKFARHRPGADDMRQAFEAAQRLVVETRPSGGAPAAPPPGGDA